jgi:hypothetical protein
MKCSIIFVLATIVGWNIFLVQRDQKLFRAYDACTQFTYHPDCPYKK